jgi:uncharacterized membrane protein
VILVYGLEKTGKTVRTLRLAWQRYDRKEIVMRKLFEAADRYVETSDWKIIAVLKFCLISLGVILGMEVKEKSRKPVFIAAVSVFIATYIPLMTRFVRIFRELRK